MKAIDVFRRIERAHDRGFIDLWRRRRLHEDAVNRGIAIQFVNAREQFILCRRRRQFEFHGMQAELAAHFIFRAHVSARCRIIAHQNHGQARLHAALF